MNRAFIILFLLMAVAPSMAQKITGKWKPVKIYSTDLGEMPVEPAALREYAFKKTVEEKNGAPLTAEDTLGVEALVTEMSQQFGSMSTEFKADKTYIARIGTETRTGKYVYDAAKKTLVTYPKGKPARKAKATFVNGLLKLENVGEDMILFMQRV